MYIDTYIDTNIDIRVSIHIYVNKEKHSYLRQHPLSLEPLVEQLRQRFLSQAGRYLGNICG